MQTTRPETSQRMLALGHVLAAMQAAREANDDMAVYLLEMAALQLDGERWMVRPGADNRTPGTSDDRQSAGLEVDLDDR